MNDGPGGNSSLGTVSPVACTPRPPLCLQPLRRMERHDVSLPSCPRYLRHAAHRATTRPPLGDDDRTGLRVLYPHLSDSLHIGSIQGRILPANPISHPVSPPGVTGLFGAQVVAVDTASGNIVAATIRDGVVLRQARRNPTEPIGLKDFP